MDWERFLRVVVKHILEEQSPQSLLTVRGYYYELLGGEVRADDAAGRKGDCISGGVHRAIHGAVQTVFVETMMCLLVVKWLLLLMLQ